MKRRMPPLPPFADVEVYRAAHRVLLGHDLRLPAGVVREVVDTITPLIAHNARHALLAHVGHVVREGRTR